MTQPNFSRKELEDIVKVLNEMKITANSRRGWLVNF